MGEEEVESQLVSPPVAVRAELQGWSRKWILGASLLLAVGGILPQANYAAVLLNWDTEAGLVWPWDLEANPWGSWREILAPFALALVGFGALACGGMLRGIVASLVAIEVMIGFWWLPGAGFDKTLVTSLVVLVGLAAIASGNHVHERLPSACGPRVVAGLGGGLCLLTLLLPAEGFVEEKWRGGRGYYERPIIDLLTSNEEWRSGWPCLALGVLALGYAVLGLGSLLPPRTRSRPEWTSRCARALLVSLPLAVFGQVEQQAGFRIQAFYKPALRALRLSSIIAGEVLLVSVGLAVVLEIALTARAVRSRTA